jgi:thiol-disulfide isomerase/thioredoxin
MRPRVIWHDTPVIAALLTTALLAASPPVEVSAYQGKVLVLNFWASWCEPCRKELPALERVHRRFASSGVEVLGVSIDEPEEHDDARRLIEDLGISFPTRLDGATTEMAALGLATSIPATAIFDRDGTRTFRIIGEASEADVFARVEWLLGDRAGARPPELVLPAGITPEHFAEHERGEEDEHEHEEQSESEGGSAVPT